MICILIPHPCPCQPPETLSNSFCLPPPARWRWRCSPPAQADDTYDAAIKDIESTMGGVPSFIGQFPKAGLPGAWAEVKALELSDETALPPKVKSLISLAVAAQIPCTYCIW